VTGGFSKTSRSGQHQLGPEFAESVNFAEKYFVIPVSGGVDSRAHVMIW
jgi:hypothetical protein